MAFTATLHIEGHKTSQDGLPVSSFSFDFSQTTGPTGEPASRVRGGMLNVSIQNLNDFDIHVWMLTPVAKKNGKIVIVSDKEAGKSFQTIEFKDGVLVYYQQSFSEFSGVVASLSISCRKMHISGAMFENRWTDTEKTGVS
jgi:hypothetical protein